MSSDTNALLEKRFDAIDQRFDEVLGAMSQFAESVDMRFVSIEARLNAIEDDIADLKESHNRLVNTVDGFIARLDKYEAELAARDHEIERLKRWIKQIADKTGVELKA